MSRYLDVTVLEHIPFSINILYLNIKALGIKQENIFEVKKAPYFTSSAILEY